ncbi:MAG: acylneuraminate cytidylyltransferase family protein [Candidatus Omnitrophota bacterium]
MKAERNILGIIPARGNSKRIPRKNIARLDGRPLIFYTIREALRSRYLDRVVVSSEDKEIIGMSRRYGAGVIKRPGRLARDRTPTEPVLLHALEYLKRREGYLPDIVVLLQATSPLRGAKIIDGCIERFIKSGADSLLTVCEDRAYRWRLQNKRIKPLYDINKRRRSQDVMPLYKENGAVYITRRETLVEHGNRLWGKIDFFVMDEKDSIEIDHKADLLLAEQVLRSKKKI